VHTHVAALAIRSAPGRREFPAKTLFDRLVHGREQVKGDIRPVERGERNGYMLCRYDVCVMQV
jgi:hypothetical protein